MRVLAVDMVPWRLDDVVVVCFIPSCEFTRSLWSSLRSSSWNCGTEPWGLISLPLEFSCMFYLLCREARRSKLRGIYLCWKTNFNIPSCCWTVLEMKCCSFACCCTVMEDYSNISTFQKQLRLCCRLMSSWSSNCVVSHYDGISGVCRTLYNLTLSLEVKETRKSASAWSKNLVEEISS